MMAMSRTVNDTLRKYFFEKIEHDHFIPILKELNFVYAIEKIRKQRSLNDDCKNLMYELFLQISYLDAYKIIVDHNLNNTLTTNDIKMCSYLSQIETYQDLLNFAKVDPIFYQNLLKYMYQFYDTPSLGKILMIKSLTPEDNQKLINQVPLHQNDLLNYDRKISPQLFSSYYRQINHFQNMVGSVDFLASHVISAMVGFIQKLNSIRKEETAELLLQMIDNDYQWSIYLVDNYDLEQEDKNYRKMLIALMEDPALSKEDIMHLCVENYLPNLLTSFIDISVQQKYKGIEEEEIKQYFKKRK